MIVDWKDVRDKQGVTLADAVEILSGVLEDITEKNKIIQTNKLIDRHARLRTYDSMLADVWFDVKLQAIATDDDCVREKLEEIATQALVEAGVEAVFLYFYQ